MMITSISPPQESPGGFGGKDDLIEVATHALTEENDNIKAGLLRVFGWADFPLDPEGILHFVSSSNPHLEEIALDVLSRLRDDRIHALAVELLQAGKLEQGLSLLVKNWRKKDDMLIRKNLLPSKQVSHATQMSIIEIYMEHRSNSCGDILYHVYENGPCSFCRNGIVEAMAKNKVLTDQVLQECLYDSYEDTRILAQKRLGK